MVDVYRAKLGKRKTETAAMRKAVALKLADCAHDDGTSIYPSIKRIADECEISERSVQRVIAGFLDEKLLLVDNENWNGKTNRYRFNFNILEAFPRTRPRNSGTGDRVSPQVNEGDKVSAEGDTETPQPDKVTPRGDTETPEPSLNRPKPSEKKAPAASRRASRKSQSQSEKKGMTPMAPTPSPSVLAHGYDLAKGWDRKTMLVEFREWLEGNDTQDIDGAWLGFCRFKGPHVTAKPYKVTGQYDPKQKRGITLTPLDATWKLWLAELSEKDAAAARERGSLTVPSRWPKREKVAA